MSVRLLHITDIHFWEVLYYPNQMMNKRMLGNLNVYLRRRHHFLQDRAFDYLKTVEATGIKNILLGGDFTSTATPGEFDKAKQWTAKLAEFSDSLLMVPGNHDVYTFESLRAKRYEQFLSPYSASDTLPAISDIDKQCLILRVPTVCPNILSSRGIVKDKEIGQMLSLIEDAPNLPLIVLGHYPFLHETYGYTSSNSRQLRNADALRKALGSCGRSLLYVAGHVHKFSYVQDPEFPQVQQLTSPAYFLHRPETDISGAFTEIHAGESGFKVFLHEHRRDWGRTEMPLCDISGTVL